MVKIIMESELDSYMQVLRESQSHNLMHRRRIHDFIEVAKDVFEFLAYSRSGQDYLTAVRWAWGNRSCK